MSTLPAWFKRELRVGDEGTDVCAVQALLGLPPTGYLDSSCASLLGAFTGLKTGTGDVVVTPEVAEWLGERQRTAVGLPPTWYGNAAKSRVALLRLLSLGPEDNLSDALRRFQGDVGLGVTGELNEATAIALGE